MSHLAVSVPEGKSGELVHAGEQFMFRYALEAERAQSIAFAMPVRAEEYSRPTLMPIFQMNMPEGFLLEQIRNRLAKTTPMNPMLLLAITGSNDPIGRLSVELPKPLAGLVGGAELARGERLDEILAWDGSEDLFAMLVEKYVLRSGISGVQPKLLVPMIERKATASTNELIIKSEGRDYPNLAINEFLCMSIAKAAGLEVPEFYLSDNHKMFVMRRFDRVDGRRLGFEDMAVLTGRGTEQKYEGSYAMLAKAVRVFCPPEQVNPSLEALYRSVVVSCVVGNGDAHLKNFGLLYTNPEANDARLAPAYDIVNTTAYIPEDSLALSLDGSKSLFASRLGLMSLATTCGIAQPREVIEQVLAGVASVLAQHGDLVERAPEVAAAIMHCAQQFEATFAGSRTAVFHQMLDRVRAGAGEPEEASRPRKGPSL